MKLNSLIKIAIKKNLLTKELSSEGIVDGTLKKALISRMNVKANKLTPLELELTSKLKLTKDEKSYDSLLSRILTSRLLAAIPGDVLGYEAGKKLGLKLLGNSLGMLGNSAIPLSSFIGGIIGGSTGSGLTKGIMNATRNEYAQRHLNLLNNNVRKSGHSRGLK